MKINKAGFKSYCPYLMLIIFSVCTSLSEFLIGDDFLWFYSKSDSSLASWGITNGRVFSNWLTYLLVRSNLFRTVFIALTFFLFILILSRLFDFERKIGKSRIYLCLFLFVLIPRTTYAETVNWISGYTNYVISILLLFIYVSFAFRCVFLEYKPRKVSSVLFLPLALACGLCVEHITIYCAFFSVLMLIIIIRKNKTAVIHSLMFTAGAFASVCIMFFNDSYKQIYLSGDEVGNRYFELGIANIMQNAYSFVVMHYTKDFWPSAVLITCGLTFLYFKYEAEKTKYMKLSMTVCWLYSSYSVFTDIFENLRSNTPEMKIIALETAFSFLYVVSIAYLAFVLLKKGRRCRVYIYLASTFLLTAPFVLISPSTARCYFANYMFWILICGEILSEVYEHFSERLVEKIRGFASAVTFSVVFLISYICLTNKYYNVVRIDYIKEQLQDESRKHINIITLPYRDYTIDEFYLCISENYGIGETEYRDYILRYYNIDADEVARRKYIEYGTKDYYIEKNQ